MQSRMFLLQNRGPGHAIGEEFRSCCSLLCMASGQGLWDLISHDFVLYVGVKKGGV